MAVYLLAGIVSWPVVRVLFRLRADGLENLPRDGGFVLAANHISNLDPCAIGIKLWPGRRLRWMAKAELFNPVTSRILRAGGAFPVRRGEHDQAAVEKAIDVVRGGDVLVMFPEGTRREKGLRKKFQPRPHTGAARIALAAGAPLVPAAIRGTDRLTRLGPLRVVYGRPLDLGDLRDRDPKEAAELATERLMSAIRDLERSV